MSMRTIRQLPYDHDELFNGEISHRIPYHRMYGKSYCVPALTMYEKTELTELQAAAAAVHNIYRKVQHFVQRYMPDEYLVERLGIHPGLLRAARMEAAPDGITRQDWIVGEAGIKCIENNTDTTTGIPEAAYLEGKLLEILNEGGGSREDTALVGPSSGMDEAIQRAMTDLIHFYSSRGLGTKVYFTCYDWHIEDQTNTKYIMRLCEQAGFEVVYAPLEELEIIPGEGLYHRGEPIHILYRLYPLEYLIDDREEDSGLEVGQALMDMVADGKIGLINPPQHIITQSKGFTATVWSLYERNEQTPEFCGFRLFDDRELEVIRTYLLPTYFEPTVFMQNKEPYVAKGIWGREGKGTHLIEPADTENKLEVPALTEQLAKAAPSNDSDDPNEADAPLTPEQEEAAHIAAYYEGQPKIYQRLWPMQSAEVQTEEGLYHGYVLTGVFVIGGRFAGILPRIGEKVTGDMAYYCAAAVPAAFS
ncbi:glutathionylspermidine synthase family protein [Paenibacillus peoriae]|uniref:glutathionylspermidine synthase family protein n=1 Tax=Paenibacillus peoriae TaxID=59893 RepID=UPI000318D1C3|nr:glutathionylspermidine synthase family protein [Paenibacillus peoriae]MEC0183620.1 glutathionylspermidine synthase family protein [Paenibacillus peoriae]